MTKLSLLFKKEWTLNLKPASYIYIYSVLSLLILIPEYPYFVSFAYCLIGIPTLFSYLKGNKDLEFNAMLPLSRTEIVKSKILCVTFIQGLQIATAIPCALVSALVLNPAGNLVGLDANFTLFAFALLGYSIFNLLFLPNFFGTGYKVAKPTVFAFIGYLSFTLIAECLVMFVPTLHTIFDGYAYLGAQLILLGVAIVAYAVSIYLTYKLSVKRFEKVNL